MKDFESFADKHWTLERWYNNTKLIFPQKWKNILVGTHKLELMINGDYFNTDQLVDLKEKYSWNDILVIRDRDFYENIGKYDQFVGGWDDPFDNDFDIRARKTVKFKHGIEVETPHVSRVLYDKKPVKKFKGPTKEVTRSVLKLMDSWKE